MGELSGSTSWMGTLYLSALAACEEMAELEDDAQSADQYRRLRERGTRNQNQTLWNGAYYVQSPDEDAHEDYGDGCHIDQVLGEWWAPQVNLPGHYPRVKYPFGAAVPFCSTISSIIFGRRHSDRENLSIMTMRPLKMISWAKESSAIPQYEIRRRGDDGF